MSHFPLLVILGNFMKRILKYVAKSRWLLIYERPRKHFQVRVEYMFRVRAWMFKFTQYIHTNFKMCNLVF